MAGATSEVLRLNVEYVVDDRLWKKPITLNVTEDRIEFLSSPFNFKDELKACFRGTRWHGRDAKPRKIWSIENTPGNIFQLHLLAGSNPYEWFERPLQDVEFNRPDILKDHQKDMIRRGLTYHYQILAAEQRLGKTLASIEIMEGSGKQNWWFVGPIPALRSVELELEKWGLGDKINLVTKTYEGLVDTIRYNLSGLKVPDGIFFDESSSLKNPAAQRTIAAQTIADMIRAKHGMDGYVILLSGTPSAKHPTDLWAQAEIAYPGYLREGSLHEFEKRIAIMQEEQDMDGIKFLKRLGWREDEVQKIPRRLEGLMTVYRRKDWLDLPEKVYRTIRMEPSDKVQRVCKTLCRIAPNTITALTWTRALSSGFQYVTKQIGTKECPVCNGAGTYSLPTEDVCPACNGYKVIAEYARETVKVQTPKDDAFRDILDEYDTHGRLVAFGSFQGSIDRMVDVAIERAWACVVIDGRGWRVLDAMGKQIKEADPLRFWASHHGKVVVIANPGSARFGLNLSLATAIVFYDNSFSAEHRLQSEDRIFAVDMDLSACPTIIDLVHLDIDQLVIDTLRANKELEHMSLGVLNERIGIGDDDSSDPIVEEELEAIA